MRHFLYYRSVVLLLIAGQISVWCAEASGGNPAQAEQKLNPVAANMDLWPDSWDAYHSRFLNYVEARKKFWPQPKIEFKKPYQLEWAPIVSKGWGSYTYEQRDGLQFYRHGRHSLSISSDGMKHSLQSLYQGDYVASVWRFVRGYQHMSPPFYFRVISEKNEDDDKQNKRIELIQPKFEGEFFPNQWWYDNADFHLWSTAERTANKFFENPRPFKPSVTLEEFGENDEPAVKRSLLSPELEELLELRIYYEGCLVRMDSAANIRSWTFNYGPGHYVFLIVAPDDDGGAHIVARPFQTWFPDEGDGILRLVPLDTDKDGIPDYWEKWYDLNPKDPKDADNPYEGSKKVSFLDYYENEKRYQKVR